MRLAFYTLRSLLFVLWMSVTVVPWAVAVLIYSIFVRGDRAVEYGHVARVMARIKEAGFRKISLVTEVVDGGG